MQKYRPKSLSAKVNNILKSQELKWFDTAVSVATPGLVTPVNLVPQGDDVIARDGRKILMKSLWMRITGLSQAVGTNPICPRVALVYDKNPNGVLPVITDIFTSTSSTAFKNMNNQERFVILYDNTAGLGDAMADVHIEIAGNTGSTPYSQYHVNKYVPLNHTAVYGPTGSGTIVGSQTGGLYIVALGESSTAVGVAGNFRLRFLDS